MSPQTYAAALCAAALLAACRRETNLPAATAVPPAAATCAPVLSDSAWYASGRAAPLFDGLESVSMPIAHTGDSVQRYFDQGLALAYGFNHAEAARSFHYARRLDPDCAMAHWGYAYVLGPNYNAPMAPDAYEPAYEAARRAAELAREPVEVALTRALMQRYQPEPPDDRGPLDERYAEAMRAVYEAFPDNANVATLYAEAMLDLHPWQLYDLDGEPQPWTLPILAALDRALELDPQHGGAHHLYIHATEASTAPEQALVSARALGDGLVPGAGHLMHMPAHVYIRTGDYHAGSLACLSAESVDSAYVTACRAQGTYPLTYYPHNQHFLAATAALEGDGATAIRAAELVAANADRQLMPESEWATLQHFSTIPWYVLVKFARWEELLARPAPVDKLAYPRAVRHYAQGLAHLHTGDADAASAHLDSLVAIGRGDALADLTIWDINTLSDVVSIAEHVLRGELLATAGLHEQAIAELEVAVAIEDLLNYNEPPDWFFSVRHTLGDVLLDAGRYAEAAEVYEADLERLPKNGWALSGLAAAYTRAERADRAGTAERRFAEAWAHADVALDGSRVR